MLKDKISLFVTLVVLHSLEMQYNLLSNLSLYIKYHQLLHIGCLELAIEKFEYTKGAIRNCISEKPGTDKNNGLQNTTQKTKYRVTRKAGREC